MCAGLCARCDTSSRNTEIQQPSEETLSSPDKMVFASSEERQDQGINAPKHSAVANYCVPSPPQKKS